MSEMNPTGIRIPSEGAKGVQEDGRATATCFCGQVQLLLVCLFRFMFVYDRAAFSPAFFEAGRLLV